MGKTRNPILAKLSARCIINFILKKCEFSLYNSPESKCGANQWTGFYMITASAMKGLTYGYGKALKLI